MQTNESSVYRDANDKFIYYESAAEETTEHLLNMVHLYANEDMTYRNFLHW